MLPLLARLYGAVVQQNPTTIPGLTKELADLTDLTEPQKQTLAGIVAFVTKRQPPEVLAREAIKQLLSVAQEKLAGAQ